MAKYSSLKSRYKKYILFLIFTLTIISVGLYFHSKKTQPTRRQLAKKVQTSSCDHIRFASMPISPSDKLNDLNVIHLLHAQKNGLSNPFSTNEEFNAKINQFERKFILVQVTENRFYQLKSLSHSLPYLIPEGVDMLNEIGYKFQERLKEKKYKNFRYRITSLLRTKETQDKLCHRNGNATNHSAHLYGTTVDISYKNFYNTKTDSVESSYEAIVALTKVLTEMRQECRLLVVRERHQACFHITVVVCRPK